MKMKDLMYANLSAEQAFVAVIARISEAGGKSPELAIIRPKKLTRRTTYVSTVTSAN